MAVYNLTQGDINPWAQLWACRIHQRVKHQFDFLSPLYLRQRLREIRQEFIGTNMPLTFLVHDAVTDSPNLGAVQDLAEYLGKRIGYFLEVYAPHNAAAGFEDIATSVMYFGLMLYAYDIVGCDCLDDLVIWAETYYHDPITMAIIVEDRLPENIADECWKFVYENEIVPDSFLDATIAALAVLTGALEDPFNETT